MNIHLLIASRRRVAWLLVALFSVLLLGCNRSAPAPEAAVTAPPTVAAEVTPPAATATIYTCPMHPHIQQHGPGQCPICGMNLEKREVPTATPGGDAPAPNNAEGTPPTGSADDRRVLYYYDPMRPDVHFDAAGKSPFMDMQLVPKYAEDAPGSAGVAVSAAVIQSLGIRTATPVRRDVRPRIRVPARVVADARGQARLQARVDGWIERLVVRAAGQTVAAGSVVAEIYAPELVAAQEELLLGADTAGPARERLRRFGIADADIDAVRRAGKAARRLPLRAPVSGVVTELGVREGSRVTPDTLIIDVAGRNAVWIEAQLFPAQRRLLGRSFTAHFNLPGAPDEHWQSDAGSVVPVVDATTQTLAVRFPINAGAELPLGTVLDAEIEGEARSGVLLVPVAAVIRTAQGDRVLLERSEGRFVPTSVTLGPRYGDEVEIRDGLGLGDRIVTSGQFLLDAEASLQGGLSQMDSAAPTGGTP